MDLLKKTCTPCLGSEPPATKQQVQKMLKETPGWEVYDNYTKLEKEFIFPNFSQAIKFINKVAQVSEQEGHHPDIYLYNYKKVRIQLWTHKIGGLHENDFILAAKINQIKI